MALAVPGRVGEEVVARKAVCVSGSVYFATT